MKEPSKLQGRGLGAPLFAQPAQGYDAARDAAQPQQGTFWRRFTTLFATGLVGVVALVPVISPLVEAAIAKMPEPPPMSSAALTALSLIHPTILMAGAVAVGTALAPKLGLRSHIAERAVAGQPLWPALKSEAPLAAGLGAAVALAIVATDLALRPLIGAQIQPLLETLPHNTVSMTVAGVLAGGIFEELLMRWGLMTLLAWVGWRLFQNGQGSPSRGVMLGALIGAALLFGAGHLPATAVVVPLTPLIVLRAFLLNGLAAAVYGWLFWRRSLEAGMISHATGHLVFTIASVITRFGH